MYRFEVQITPQIHDGQMKHYWNIFKIEGSAKITVFDGWSGNLFGAYSSAYQHFNSLK